MLVASNPFAIDPKISKSGRDAYSIVSGNAAVAGRPPYRGGEKGRAGSPLPAVALTITGSNLRSVWYGLYDLLERRGGCHWFWDGDVVPKRDSIDLSNLDVHEEAHFEYRAIRYFAHRGLTRFQAEHWGPEDWRREIDWLLKKRLNVFMLRIGQDDLFQRAFPEACKYPDPTKRLPGAGSSYNDRTLFWSLQYRGELRRRIQKYGFDRGLLAPEDFGTMTHLKSVWADVLDASALRRWDEYSEWNLNCAQHLVYHGILKKGYAKRPAQWGPPVAKAMAALRRLEDAPWDDEFVRRDAIDIVRMVLDRLIVLKIDELGSAIAAWRDGKTASVQQQDAVVIRARELATLFDRLADVLELHTDYSLWESYQRLDAIEKIQNPDFTKTLFENAVNQYCLSHQYEAIRHVVAPAMAELSDRIAKAVKSGDRKAGFSVHPRFGAIRKAAKAKPLESLKPTLPRTQENFVKVLREVCR